MIRVVIADDQHLVRTGFRMILSSHDDIDVVGEASNGTDAFALTVAEHPDLVLMDIRMPDMDGIEATRRIVSDPRTSDVQVLILTTFDLDEYVYDALRAGASGFLLKDVPMEQLAHAVRTLRQGDALLAPSITRRLIEQFAPTRTRTGPSRLERLSTREAEVFRLVARGMSNREISAELVLSETTVKTHVTRILGKLELRDRVQVVVLAYEGGVVVPGQPPQSAPGPGPG
jgi:DNA-binding NarL/FixJ family response regulator